MWYCRKDRQVIAQGERCIDRKTQYEIGKRKAKSAAADPLKCEYRHIVEDERGSTHRHEQNQ